MCASMALTPRNLSPTPPHAHTPLRSPLDGNQSAHLNPASGRGEAARVAVLADLPHRGGAAVEVPAELPAGLDPGLSKLQGPGAQLPAGVPVYPLHSFHPKPCGSGGVGE